MDIVAGIHYLFVNSFISLTNLSQTKHILCHNASQVFKSKE